MEPPSYEEASRQAPVRATDVFTIFPPPAYDASLPSPSTPPPTYGEAVTVQPDPFPVLALPSVPPAVTSPHQNIGVTVHPITQVNVTAPRGGRRTQAVVTQPQPSPISVPYLRDSPGLVRCTNCHHLVTTKVQYVPGKSAWCMCVLLTLMGLVCGFCLIPLMVRGLQDVHHSCPRCQTPLHVYQR